MKIGVLAAQGAFAEHLSVLGRLDVEAIPIRLPEQLSGLSGLVIPGGGEHNYKQADACLRPA